MPLTLKDASKKIVIGFNNSSAPLGERNDLHKLFEIAKSNNNKRLLDLFSEHPTDDELKSLKGKSFIQKQNVKPAIK